MKKKVFPLLFLIIAISLTACSGVSINGLVAALDNASQDSTNLTLESKLGPGILLLEGTDQAVTSEQAVELLPIWKAVRVMTTDKNSCSVEIAALYSQTMQILAPNQAEIIQEMTWSQDEIDDLVLEYDAKPAPVGSLVSSRSQTLTSFSATEGGPGGDFGPGGFGGPGSLDAQISTGANNTGLSSVNATKSSVSNSAASPVTLDLNSLFADAVVALLQQRVGP